MSKILIAGDSPDILLSVKGVLRSGGHQVNSTTGPDQAAHLLDENAIDAMVLGVMTPDGSGLDVLKAIRARPRGMTVPILLVSARGKTEDLVRALRGGADDYLVKPFEPLELLARVERLISRRSPGTGLAGSLESFTPGEVLQNLSQGSKTGRMELSAELDMARVQLRGGYIVEARLGRLRGRDALMAILELKSGFFSFEPTAAGGREEEDEESRLPLAKLLLEAAWLEDELLQREADLPAPDHSLIAVAPPPNKLPEAYADLPFEAVHHAIVHSPDIDRQDLVALRIASPSRVLLALAVMVEQGSIEEGPLIPLRGNVSPKRPEGAGDPPTDEPVDPADPLFRLITACEQRGFGPEDTIHVLILFQPQAWGELLALVEIFSAEKLTARRHLKLLEQLDDRRGGLVRLSQGRHEILLHLQSLGKKKLREVTLPPNVAGVVLWLTEKTWSLELTNFVVNTEAVASRSGSVVLLPDRALLGRVKASLGALHHCSVSADPPRSFSDLVSLLVDAFRPTRSGADPAPRPAGSPAAWLASPRGPTFGG